MLRRFAFYMVGLALLLAPGCGGSRGVAKGNYNGIEYDFPSFGSVMTSIDSGSGLAYKTQGLQVEIRDDGVTVNGKDYGQLKSGDRLRVSADFKVWINDKEASPVP